MARRNRVNKGHHLVRRRPLSLSRVYSLQRQLHEQMGRDPSAEEGKLEVSYRWFRTYQDVEAFYFGLIRPDPPRPPKGPPFDT